MPFSRSYPLLPVQVHRYQLYMILVFKLLPTWKSGYKDGYFSTPSIVIRGHALDFANNYHQEKTQLWQKVASLQTSRLTNIHTITTSLTHISWQSQGKKKKHYSNQSFVLHPSMEKSQRAFVTSNSVVFLCIQHKQASSFLLFPKMRDPFPVYLLFTKKRKLRLDLYIIIVTKTKDWD